MTITQFSELVVEMLGENNHDKIDDRVVLAMADTYRGALLGEIGSVTGDFTKTFTVDVKPGLRGKYIDLPCDLCAVANNGAFVFVGPEDEETNYIPMKPATVSAINNMEMGALGGRTGFWQEGRKLYFRFLPVPAPDKLMLKLIPNLFWLYENAGDDELMGSADLEAKLLQMCFDGLKVKAQIPEDKDNTTK